MHFTFKELHTISNSFMHFTFKELHTISNSFTSKGIISFFYYQMILKAIYKRPYEVVVFTFSLTVIQMWGLLKCLVWFDLIHYSAFWQRRPCSTLDRNPGPGYDTLLLRLIPGDLLSACRHRQFHTLRGLLDSRDTLPNSYPSALRAMQGGSLYHGLWYDLAGRRTHDLPCESRHANHLANPTRF